MRRRRDHREILQLIVILSLQWTQGRNVRRLAPDASLPWKLFGSDPKAKPEPGPDHEDDQTIRNGNEIFPIPWFVALQGQTVCGGSLIHGDM
jgi:hypothetical protein